MDVGTHIAELEREGRLLVDAARGAGLSSWVPSCPEWRTAELLAHMGVVHRWATRYVATALPQMVPKAPAGDLLASAPPGDARYTWVEDGHAALVSALRNAPSDLRCWTFLEATSPLAMWSRRQAHETTVHRVDAELAEGRAIHELSDIDPMFAADGLDELLLGFFGRATGPGDRAPDASPSTIGLEATDLSGRWAVRVANGTVATARGFERADLVVRGPAADLYLLMWHRRPLDGLDVQGEPGDFDRLWAAERVEWG